MCVVLLRICMAWFAWVLLVCAMRLLNMAGRVAPVVLPCAVVMMRAVFVHWHVADVASMYVC